MMYKMHTIHALFPHHKFSIIHDFSRDLAVRRKGFDNTVHIMLLLFDTITNCKYLTTKCHKEEAHVEVYLLLLPCLHNPLFVFLHSPVVYTRASSCSKSPARILAHSQKLLFLTSKSRAHITPLLPLTNLVNHRPSLTTIRN